MHIIIPMSGIGKRFVDAGFKQPKPLIEIDGHPIIEHVVGLFPGESNISFICNEDHLANTNMREVLARISPKAQVYSIAQHRLGPVYAVSKIFDKINNDEEVIVNYCDFGTYWNYPDFLQHTRSRNADGAVVAYRGFHPHMLGGTNYAFMRSKNQWMIEIQEKKPFTSDRMSEFASNGTYYFKNGEILKKYFTKLIESKQDLNGEYYVSMVYNLLVANELKVSIYKIQHMLQWGTPEDVLEYNQWSQTFSHLTNFRPFQSPPLPNTHLVVPMAGRGSRFQAEGHVNPKPLIEVSGQPMVVQALQLTPVCAAQTFICLQEHLDKYPLRTSLLKKFPHGQVMTLDCVSEGQASTCWARVKNLPADQSIMISACDNGMIWNHQQLCDLINDPSNDGIIFTFRGHPQAIRFPEMYGWVDIDSKNIDKENFGLVRTVSVKRPLPGEGRSLHPIVVGTFWIRRAADFNAAYEKMVRENIRVNGEFYVDSLMAVMAEMGFKIREFPIESYICWGTPNELNTFEYWQSYFAKAKDHPYKFNVDPYLPKEKIEFYQRRANSFKQEDL